MPADMGIQIFYSGTNFNTRTDVFSAALTTCKADEAIKTMAQALIEKAKQYSAFRNKIAHDQPLLSQHGGMPGQPAEFEILMVHGKGQLQTHSVKKHNNNDAI